MYYMVIESFELAKKGNVLKQDGIHLLLNEVYVCDIGSYYGICNCRRINTDF